MFTARAQRALDRTGRGKVLSLEKEILLEQEREEPAERTTEATTEHCGKTPLLCSHPIRQIKKTETT